MSSSSNYSNHKILNSNECLFLLLLPSTFFLFNQKNQKTKIFFIHCHIQKDVLKPYIYIHKKYIYRIDEGRRTFSSTTTTATRRNITRKKTNPNQTKKKNLKPKWPENKILLQEMYTTTTTITMLEKIIYQSLGVTPAYCLNIHKNIL